MKILVICQYYYPEPFRVTDICEELAKRGHEVTVITGVPNYPMGKIYNGYKHGKNRDETINGVKVHRCFTIGRRTGVIWRFLNYYSYAFSSTQYVKTLKSDYDVIFVNQLSPVMMVYAGIKYKILHDKKLVLYCLDLWPESLTSGGISRGSFMYKYYHKVSESTYKQADKILVTTNSFSSYFKDEFGIIDTIYVPQYAENIFKLEECYKDPDDTFDLMFAGNIGVVQSVDTIVKAAALTKDIPNLKWHILGDGSELDNLKSLAEELDIDNVIFHDRKPIEEMPKYYAMADVMLVTMQKDSVLSMTMPGKIQTYMAAGKPILGAIDGETKTVLYKAKCGMCCKAEDFVALSQMAKELFSKTKEEMAKLSANARRYHEENYDKTVILNKIESYLIGSE